MTGPYLSIIIRRYNFPPKPQEVTRVETDQSITKETILIKIAESKNRFQVDTFLDTPVTLSIWQLLDQSPQ